MTRRTPYSDTPIPPNFNWTGRPLDNEGGEDWDDPEVVQFLTAPRLIERLDALVQQGRLPPDVANHVLVAARQHYRALNGDRARPGEVLGTDSLPTEPMPHADEEPFLEDRTPGTQGYKVMREAVERMDVDRLSDTLIAQMRENDPGDSTWARSDPSYRPPSATQDTSPPSLRETLEASAQALGGPHQEN